MKIMKKVLITVLCFCLLLSALSACSPNNGSSSNTTKPDSGNSSGQGVNSNTPDNGSKTPDGGEAKDPSSHPTRPPKPEKPKDVIIPLYDEAYESEIRNLNPWDLNTYKWFSKYFPLSDSGKESEKGIKYEQLKAGSSFKIKPYPGIKDVMGGEDLKNLKESYEATLYFYERFDNVVKHTEIDGVALESGGASSIPIFYNETQGCFAGFISENSTCRFCEFYYDPIRKVYHSQLAYPADYGYTNELTELPEKAKSLDEIIPLFDTKYEKEILESSPKDLFEADNFKKYLALEVGDGSDPENGPFYLGSGRKFALNILPMSLEDEYITHDVELSYRKIDSLRMFYKVDEKPASDFGNPGSNFFPMYYNKTLGCIVGYLITSDNSEPEWVQLNVVFGSGLTSQNTSGIKYGLSKLTVEASTEPRKDEEPELLSVFYWDMEEEIKKEDPLDLFKEETFRKYFQLSETDKTSDMVHGDFYKIETDFPLEIRTASGNPQKDSAVIELYVEFQKSEPQVSLYYELNNEIKWSGICVPLYYNSTEGCLVTYDAGYDGTNYDLQMVDSFYSDGNLFGQVIKKEKYGF